jgi:hypothetical protein
MKSALFRLPYFEHEVLVQLQLGKSAVKLLFENKSIFHRFLSSPFVMSKGLSLNTLAVKGLTLCVRN